MANLLDTIVHTTVSRVLPASNPDGASSNPGIRGGRYGEIYVKSMIPTKHALCDEGSYFLCPNSATFDTPATYALQTAFSATAPAYVIRNNDAAGGKSIYLDYIRLICATVGNSATSVRLGVILDTGSRQPTAGNAVMTPFNTNISSMTGSVSVVNQFSGAAQTVPAAVSARTCGSTTLKQSIPITGDEYICYFGGVDAPATVGGTAAAITIAGKYASGLPPVVIGPQSTALIYLWEPGVLITAPTFTSEMAWWER